MEKIYMSNGKDYGQLFIDFLNKKSDTKLNANDNQYVYTLVPYKYQYKNDDAICKQLCILATDFFFKSHSFASYTRSLIHVFKDLLNHKIPLTDLKNYSFNKGIIDTYSHMSKFIKGSDISKEIIKFAINLDDMQKASIIFIIGGHTVNVTIINNAEKITFCYYDPYHGQLYKQIVSKSELLTSLETENYFLHPKSILNNNNVLIGELAIFDTGALDHSVPLTLMEIIVDNDFSKNIFKKNSLSFSENLSHDEITKHLAMAPAMLDIMLYITNRNVFNNFLNEYGSKLIREIEKVQECVKSISSCSIYLKDILQETYQPLIEKGSNYLPYKIKNLYSHRNEENVIDFSIYNKFYDDKQDICIKNLSTVSTEPLVVSEFYKILFSEENSLSKAMHQCVIESTKKAKLKVVKNICNEFSHADTKVFLKANNDYYKYQDSKMNYKEKCNDYMDVDEYLIALQLSGQYEEL